MSVIRHVLEEELDRLEKLIPEYEQKLKNIPDGSVSRKKRNKKYYLYRAYRDKGKINFVYIGHEDSDAAKQALADRKERIRYQQLLKKVKADIRELKRALSGYR